MLPIIKICWKILLNEVDSHLVIDQIEQDSFYCKRNSDNVCCASYSEDILYILCIIFVLDNHLPCDLWSSNSKGKLYAASTCLPYISVKGLGPMLVVHF